MRAILTGCVLLIVCASVAQAAPVHFGPTQSAPGRLETYQLFAPEAAGEEATLWWGDAQVSRAGVDAAGWAELPVTFAVEWSGAGHLEARLPGGSGCTAT